MSNLTPYASFESLKKEILKIDPVAFAENYLTLNGQPLKLTGTGWKFMADLYRHITSVATSPQGKPIVVVKGRQVGMTTAASVLDLYFVASGNYGVNGKPPVTVMHAFPLLEHMHSFSKERLEKMINSSVPSDEKDNKGRFKPYIETQQGGRREATNSLRYKQFKYGNDLWCESIGADGTRVRGRSVDIFFFDEVQDMLKEAIGVAVQCLSMAKYGPKRQGVQVYFGTPKQKGTHFFDMWENSDQRRFYLGCAECKKYFLLYTPESDKWMSDIWLYGNIVKCPNCEHEQDKSEAIERGKWIPTPGKENAPYTGFHFNQLFIPGFEKEHILKEHPENNPTKTEIQWNNEVLGEFHSGESLPITFEEIYHKCRDQDRLVIKMSKKENKTTYLGLDWGKKPDVDGRTRGKSYSCGVIISVEHEGKILVENAFKLKKLGFEDKKDFVDSVFRSFDIKSAAGDIGFAEDISSELKIMYGDKYKTVRSSGSVNGGVKYNRDELEIVIDKDKTIEEVFNLLRRGQIRFPWGSYERIGWLIQHCCSMESKLKIRNGQPYQTFVKGSIQNDGFMALIYAYLAYKFDQTHGFKTTIADQGRKIRPILAYLPKMR